MKMKIKSAILMTALVLILTAILPLAAAYAETKGVVKGGWLVLRSSPSFAAEIRASYPTGTVVTISGQVGSWYQVVTPDGLTGYMYGDYLQVSSNGGGGSVSSDTIAYVTSRNGLNVRLRSGPGKGYSILASYAPGTKCTVLSAGSNWCRIQIGRLTGYMMTEFLTTSSIATPRPVQPEISGEQVYVTSRNGQGVNLRSGPGKDYPSIGFYSVGTSAVMITRGSTWSLIQIGNRYGYMMTQFLTTTQQEDPYTLPATGAYVVSANGKSVNLRSSPSTAGAVIKSFKVGTRLTIIARGSEWYFVQIGDYYGYMMRQFIYDSSNSNSGGSAYDAILNLYDGNTTFYDNNPATTTDLGF